ncbi:phage head morphogenesis protein [Pasteurellaceae bacterium 15-036681]|nr:phage head morphogenesis protein [Pasteurellaceae bacterium 15-036681]
MGNVSFAFDLEPTKAIEFLKQKGALVDKVDKKGLYDSALARATAIANMSSLEMTKDIYHSLEKAQKDGIAFEQWRKDLMSEFKRKGWIAGINEKTQQPIIADPKTGEIFGSPRRLETIYRTNMQAAYSAQRYQQMMDNVDNRPYWQYSAVNDSRTRPAHSAMNGLVYRYDDPFWATFYPPNGFNCRCSVIALAERDIKRRGIDVGDSGSRLVEVERESRKGDKEKTIAFKTFDERVTLTDKGFDYNVGRISYRPNLDLYPEQLAHEFAKVEMSGGQFAWTFNHLSKAIAEIKQAQGLDGKIDNELMFAIRDKLRLEYKFASGVINSADAKLLGVNQRTAWLSDDTLVKQFNSRDGQNFGIDEYARIPDVVFDADRILRATQNDNVSKLYFYKEINERWYMVVIKQLKNTQELFVESFRFSSLKQIEKEVKKYEVVRVSH